MDEAYKEVRTSRGKKVKVYDRRTKEKRRVKRKKWLRSPAGKRYQRQQRRRSQRIKRGSIRINKKRSRALKAANAYQRKNKAYKVRKYRGPKYTIRY